MQKNFLMGLKIWWSWGSGFFFSKSPKVGRFSIFHAKLQFLPGWMLFLIPFLSIFCLFLPKPWNQVSRRSIARLIKTASQPDSQPVDNQLEGRSVATWVVPTQLLSNRRYRAPPTTPWLGSGGLKGAGWVPARSLLTFPLAGCLLAGCLAGWLAWLTSLPTSYSPGFKA